MTEEMIEEKEPKETPKLPGEEPLKSHFILNIDKVYFSPLVLLVVIYFIHSKFEINEMLTILAFIASIIGLLPYQYTKKKNNLEKNNDVLHGCEEMTEEKEPKETPKLPSEAPLELDLILNQNTEKRELKNRRK